jgi:hypothetical protein
MSNPALSARGFVDGTIAAPLAWWTPQQLDEVAAVVRGAWTSWTQDWVLVSPQFPPSGDANCSLAHDTLGLAETSWCPLGTRQGAAAWIELRPGPTDKIRDALFGADSAGVALEPRDGIALAVAQSAWSALLDALRETLGVERDDSQISPAPELFKPWSGCVKVARPNAVAAHSLLLNGLCVRRLLALPSLPVSGQRQVSQVPLSPLAEALSASKVLVRAELAGCELDIGDLEDLAVGDVVALAHALDEPLQVAFARDRLCAAFMGRQGGFKAIELVRQSKFHSVAQSDHHLQEAP